MFYLRSSSCWSLDALCLELGGFADLFPSRLGQYRLDAVVQLESLAHFIFSCIMEPSRAERLFQQTQPAFFDSVEDNLPPSLKQVLDSLVDTVFGFDLISTTSWQARHLQHVLLHNLLSLQTLYSGCSLLVDEVVQDVLDILQHRITSLLNQYTCLPSTTAPGQLICKHGSRLLAIIAARRPILNISTLPDGPPI
jgi:hypothetical protein